ncbi:MAG: hypothetical protein WAK13_03125, partial [Terriglobales bacterium]
MKSSMGLVCDWPPRVGTAARVLLAIALSAAAITGVAQHSATAPSDDKPSVDHGAGSMSGQAAKDHGAQDQN